MNSLPIRDAQFRRLEACIVVLGDEGMFREGVAHHLARLVHHPVIVDAAQLPSPGSMLGRQLQLVVLDLQMTGMSLAQAVEIKMALKDVPLLVLSDDSGAGGIPVLRHAGISGLVFKRATSTVLLAAAQLILSGETFFQAPCTPGLLEKNLCLTKRERQIAEFLESGLPNKVIAENLGLTEMTVKSHLNRVFKKLGVVNRVQAIARLRGD